MSAAAKKQLEGQDTQPHAVCCKHPPRCIASGKCLRETSSNAAAQHTVGPALSSCWTASALYQNMYCICEVYNRPASTSAGKLITRKKAAAQIAPAHAKCWVSKKSIVRHANFGVVTPCQPLLTPLVHRYLPFAAHGMEHPNKHCHTNTHSL